MKKGSKGFSISAGQYRKQRFKNHSFRIVFQLHPSDRNTPGKSYVFTVPFSFSILLFATGIGLFLFLVTGFVALSNPRTGGSSTETISGPHQGFMGSSTQDERIVRINRLVNRLQDQITSLRMKNREVYYLIYDQEILDRECGVEQWERNTLTDFSLCDGVVEGLSRYFDFYSDQMRKIPHRNPVYGRDAYITSSFGFRRGIFRADHSGNEFHRGVDMRAREGRAVLATADGMVREVRYSHLGYGNRVRLEHPDGFETVYAHLSSIVVQKGDPVKAGDPIGRSGETGNTTGPHLHYEVILKGRPLDPEQYFVY